MIGEYRDLSILAHRWAWETGDLVFEICDGKRKVTCWVREIPTLRQAATLLDEYGGPPEEEQGHPHENDLNDEGRIQAEV